MRLYEIRLKGPYNSAVRRKHEKGELGEMVETRGHSLRRSHISVGGCLGSGTRIFLTSLFCVSDHPITTTSVLHYLLNSQSSTYSFPLLTQLALCPPTPMWCSERSFLDIYEANQNDSYITNSHILRLSNLI